MDPEFASLLACPKCQGPLELGPEPAEPEQATECLCRACQLAFAVENDIANFLLEDARPL